ncbi:HNH endonuclease [Bombiscardovia coagulans]|uniref:HNH endonuclease n=1 Tax=Bombiscardovia coagulans TaxID=686666 RepID=A0A261ESL8_9BIFI|nr:HNH endonuclease [Bombiscardovia coagulans]OZG49851.1 HNH endonuclease [Bombiscardovia coagulans]
MRVKRFIFRLWSNYKAIRYTTIMLSTVGSTGGFAWLVNRLSAWRNRLETSIDSPEFITNEIIDEQHSRWPTISFDWRLASAYWWVVALIIIFIIVWIVAHIRVASPHNGFTRDPRREFTVADRQWIDQCTARQCEYRIGLGLLRCNRRAEQLDHWYPWSKGGATDRHNLVNLCAHHNRRKSDKIPTVWSTKLLYHARLHYFPPQYRGFTKPDGIDYRMLDTDTSIIDEDYV